MQGLEKTFIVIALKRLIKHNILCSSQQQQQQQQQKVAQQPAVAQHTNIAALQQVQKAAAPQAGLLRFDEHVHCTYKHTYRLMLDIWLITIIIMVILFY